jgi:hypothetical protein
MHCRSFTQRPVDCFYCTTFLSLMMCTASLCSDLQPCAHAVGTKCRTCTRTTAQTTHTTTAIHTTCCANVPCIPHNYCHSTACHIEPLKPINARTYCLPANCAPLYTNRTRARDTSYKYSNTHPATEPCSEEPIAHATLTMTASKDVNIHS